LLCWKPLNVDASTTTADAASVALKVVDAWSAKETVVTFETKETVSAGTTVHPVDPRLTAKSIVSVSADERVNAVAAE